MQNPIAVWFEPRAVAEVLWCLSQTIIYALSASQKEITGNTGERDPRKLKGGVPRRLF